jgi:RNA polymerase sigma-70 factor (ECF subfamily)
MKPEEFDDFYARSFSRLVGQVHAMTGNWAEAQDAVQEAFIRAWDRRERFDLAESPEAWIRIVARRLAVSRLRRARRGIQLLLRNHVEKLAEPPGDEHTAVIAALRQLPEVQRRAIVLHHLCDLSVEQVAAETESSISAVKTRLSRGRVTLARLLVDAAPTRAMEKENA